MAEISLALVVVGIINAVSLDLVHSWHAKVSKICNVHHELLAIKNHFQSIVSLLWVLDRAHSEDRDLRLVGPWLSEIQAVAHDVEDIVDEYVHFLGGMNAGRRQEAIHKVKFIHFAGELAQRLKDVRPRVERICSNRDSLAREEIKKWMEDYGVATPSSIVSSVRATSFHLIPEINDTPIGTGENETLLLNWLLEEEDVTAAMIAVVGMGGIGKTALVRKVYDDPRVHRIFNRRVWVSGSSIREVKQFLSTILEQLQNSKNEHHNQADAMKNKLFQRIHEAPHENRCVIVLDDARESTCNFGLVMEGLLNMLTSNKMDCKIIITTRHEKLTSGRVNEDRILRLQPLSEDHAWSLFCKMAFADAVCPSNLEKYALKIVKRCGGLPLPLLAVGSMMSTKNKDSKTWERSLCNLTFEPSSRLWGDSSAVYNVLVPSFYELPDQQRQCFFYLSVFPEGSLISRKSLIRLWVAEGLVEVKEGMTLEEVAEEYLVDLVSRSMILIDSRNDFGRVRTCKLHDVVRDIASKIKKRQQLFTVHQESSQRLDYTSVRRLSIHSFNNAEAPAKQKDFAKLRSLLVFDKNFHVECLTRFIDTMRLLKVLDLRGVLIESIPESIFDLFSLRYLSLRETKITYEEFPKEIKRLRFLETLDLWKTQVETLPNKVYKLLNLRHLICGPKAVKLKYSKVWDRNNGIWNLTNLQTLKMVEADDEMVTHIGNLAQLRTLFISNVTQSQGGALCSCISRLTNLVGLTIKVRHGFGIWVEKVKTPPPYLQKLEMHGQLSVIPKWFDGLHNLKQLMLIGSELPKSPLDDISHVGSLAFLHLRKACRDKELHFKPQQFSELKTLYLEDLSVTSIRFDECSLPSLSMLSVDGCNELRKRPEIENLGSLKEARLPLISPRI